MEKNQRFYFHMVPCSFNCDTSVVVVVVVVVVVDVVVVVAVVVVVVVVVVDDDDDDASKAVRFTESTFTTHLICT